MSPIAKKTLSGAVVAERSSLHLLIKAMVSENHFQYHERRRKDEGRWAPGRPASPENRTFSLFNRHSADFRAHATLPSCCENSS
jgi:hypothetical protein